MICLESGPILSEPVEYYCNATTQLDKINNLHSTDTVATKNSGTRGRPIWVHSSEVELLHSSVPRNSPQA